MPFPFAAIGLGLSAISLASQIFGKSEEELTAEEIREAEKYLEEQRARQLREGVRNIISQTESSAASARTAASARMMAAGRTAPQDIESAVIPAEGQVRRYGSEALTKFQTATNESFNERIAALRMKGIGLPRSPNAGDYLGEIGAGMLRYGIASQTANPDPSTYQRAPLPEPESYRVSNEGAAPIPEEIPEGAFRMDDEEPSTYSDRFSLSRPETDYRSLQYRRTNPYAGLRRASIF